MLAACDIYRPAAIDQLEIVGKAVNTPVYVDRESRNAVKIAQDALKEAQKKGCNVLIVDTAGRLQIDEQHFHRYAMTYTPMGTDAFISNTENLVFTNTTSAPIRILAEATGGSVKITFLGTEDKEYLLDIESVTVTQYMPEIIYQSMPKDNVYGYKDGNVIQSGLTGYLVETYLCKYDPVTGLLVSRELLSTVSYEKRDIIIIKIEGTQ
jgi:hypothetical protein